MNRSFALCLLFGLLCLLNCGPPPAPTPLPPARSAPRPAAVAPIEVEPESPGEVPAEHPVKAEAPADPLRELEGLADVGAECRGADLQLENLRSGELCRVPGTANLSYDVSKRFALVAQTLRVRSGGHLDFTAQLKNLTERPLVVDLQAGAGFSSLSAYNLKQGGVEVPTGKCIVSFLTSAEWYRVEIPAGESIGVDGRFYANTARLPASQALCTPDPLPRGTYEVEVSVSVNGQELSQPFVVEVR